MEMSGAQRIPASRETVWRALNDPEILKACIPGCQELEKTSDTEMAATVVLKVGPVSARFKGAVTLSDLDPPNGYRITGEGQGGVAGFAKGEALVRLEPEGEDTVLHYQVTADVGGKLAQLGARLIDATARQMSGAFFKRFAEEIVADRAGAQGQPAAGPVSPDGTPHGTPRAPAEPRAAARPGCGSEAVGRPMSGSLIALQLIGAVIAGYAGGLLSGTPSAPFAGAGLSANFTAAVALMVVAAVGYLFGRLKSAS